MVTCKRCSQRFQTLTTLRRHQWRDHREVYQNVGKDKALIKAVNLEKPDMTVRQLLSQLKTQRTFVTDVISLVEKLSGQEEPK